MRYLIRHETMLSFPEPVREHQCELRLLPREDDGQRIVSANIEVRPEAFLGGYTDCFGNRVTTVSIVPAHDTLAVSLAAEVDTSRANPFDYDPVPPDEETAWIGSELRRDPRLWDFVLHRSGCVPALEGLDDVAAPPPRGSQQSVVDAMQEVMCWAGSTFRYQADATEVHAPLSTFLKEKAGVCQDFAHLLIAVSRSWGVPGRYVMGYLDPDCGDTGDGETEGPAPEGQRQPATHAWAEVLVPGAGWLGFDATQQLVVNDTYVTVAVGRDSLDAAPLRGSFKGNDPGDSPRVQISVSRAPQQ